jgi:serine/threonine-protein kinase
VQGLSPDEDGEERLGTVLGGRYELRDVIARGAQGLLYRAKDSKSGVDVAIKILRDAADDPDAVERLFREAQAMTRLVGTAAVKVLDQVVASNGAVGIVMELLRGRELHEELVELEAGGERMPLDRVREVFEPLVKTLDAARGLGLVHRDIKPENIFTIHPAYGGGVRLLDFGFARFTRSRPITRQGMVAGSPSYISPEAWTGAAVDHRADVYSLGVVLFRALGGKPPFSGSYRELMMSASEGARPSLFMLRPDLSPMIDGWVQHALAADRARRFQSAGALWKALLTCFPPR